MDRPIAQVLDDLSEALEQNTQAIQNFNMALDDTSTEIAIFAWKASEARLDQVIQEASRMGITLPPTLRRVI